MGNARLYLSFLVVSLAGALAGPTGAVAAKPGAGAGSSATKAGDNLADLISGNLTQLLIVLVGVFGMAAFFSRSIGQAIMIVVGGMFAGLFIIDPNNALDVFKGVYSSVF
jgi:hypothetical protein